MPHSLAAADLHTLVLLYLSVAYESDRNFEPAEQHAVLRLLRWWMPNRNDSEAEALVGTAFQAIRSGKRDDPSRLARSLGAVLPPHLHRRVLTDLGQIARADGFLSVEEASVIGRVRAALGTVEEQSRAQREDAR